MYLRRLILAEGIAVFIFFASALTGSALTVAWDRNLETNVTSYTVYYGRLPHVYSFSTNVGNVTQVTLDGLSPGLWFLAVTAVTDNGEESDFSEELQFEFGNPANLNLLLLGPNPLRHECKTAFVDPGVSWIGSLLGLLGFATNSHVNPDVLGAYTIEYAVNILGLSITNTRLVEVVDTTPPFLATGTPANRTITNSLPGEPVAVDFPLPEFADAYDGQVAVGCVPPPTAAFPVGTTQVICTSSDTSGNQAQSSFTVTVVDSPQRTLSIAVSPDGGFAELTWSPLGYDWIRLQSANIDAGSTEGSSMVWESVNATVTLSDGKCKVTLPLSGGGRIFRLNTSAVLGEP